MAPHILTLVQNKGGKMKRKKDDSHDGARPRSSSAWPFSRPSVETQDTGRPRAVTAEFVSTKTGSERDVNLQVEFGKVIEFQTVVESLEACGQEYRQALIHLKLASKPVVQQLQKVSSSNVAFHNIVSAFAGQVDGLSNQFDAAHAEVEQMLQLVQHSLAECEVVCASARKSEESWSTKCSCDQQAQELTYHAGPPVPGEEKSRVLREKFLADKAHAQRLADFEDIVSEFLERCMEDLGQMLLHFCNAQANFVLTSEAAGGFSDLADRFANINGLLHSPGLTHKTVQRRTSMQSSDGPVESIEQALDTEGEACAKNVGRPAFSDTEPLAPTMTLPADEDALVHNVPQQALSSRVSAASFIRPMDTLPRSLSLVDDVAMAPRDTLPPTPAGSCVRGVSNHGLPSLLGRSKAQRFDSLEFAATKVKPF